MMKYVLIWYDLKGEKARDLIEATSKEDATNKGFKKYHGNPPAELVEVLLEKEAATA
jgi:hypothetical protein